MGRRGPESGGVEPSAADPILVVFKKAQDHRADLDRGNRPC